jgi:hypothetical protein
VSRLGSRGARAVAGTVHNRTSSHLARELHLGMVRDWDSCLAPSVGSIIHLVFRLSQVNMSRVESEEAWVMTNFLDLSTTGALISVLHFAMALTVKRELVLQRSVLAIRAVLVSYIRHV